MIHTLIINNGRADCWPARYVLRYLAVGTVRTAVLAERKGKKKVTPSPSPLALARGRVYRLKLKLRILINPLSLSRARALDVSSGDDEGQRQRRARRQGRWRSYYEGCRVAPSCHVPVCHQHGHPCFSYHMFKEPY